MANGDKKTAAQEVKQYLQKLSAMSDLDPKEFADESGLANKLAGSYGKDELKSTQLRKIFHPLKQIERDVQRKVRGKPENEQGAFETHKVVLMMPTLAYARGRGLIPEDFYEIMKLCLREKVKTNKDFLRSVQFIEAVLAYHKFRYPSSARG